MTLSLSVAFYILILTCEFDLKIKAVSGFITNEVPETFDVSSIVSDVNEIENSLKDVFATVINSSLPSLRLKMSFCLSSAKRSNSPSR